ncbi:arginine deiminase family protein [Polyangium sp. 6x1]|uniref:arginine deiminase family protein n=1 Tax=Polyangium sp. 6x1 TaxID=3042689 RepID=UPI00248240C2|nr:arginine deiminase family protein [Polyangium sp. 6x1]MDI1446771.1 arginine deiminase family protein [Polyangium sp. 6x1]
MRTRRAPMYEFRRRWASFGVAAAAAASLLLGGHLSRAEPAGVDAHWYEADQILVHRPGEEVFLGLLHPAAALFEDTFSLEGAAAEHRQFVATLENQGVEKVTHVVDVLLAGTEDPDGEARRALVRLAKRMTILDVFSLDPEAREAQRAYFEETLAKMAPTTLVRMVLERPTVVLRYGPCGASEERSCIQAEYRLNPLMNLYFARDQMVTTARGVVLGRMANPQRAAEREVMKFVLAKMGIEPVYEISPDARMEGGDFFPAGERAFIGQGLRTNAAAIREMLNHDVFGTREVIVVKDAWQDSREMHLDTYFNLLDVDLALLVADRDMPDCDVRQHVKCLKADVWTRNAQGTYDLAHEDVDFVRLLREKGIRVLPVSVEDQRAYGINVLTVGPRRIIGAEGVSEAYKRALAAASVHATWVRFDNLRRGYGSADCITQVLRRRPPK